MKKIGRKTKANIEARKKIAQICENLNLNHCEIRFDGCLGWLFLAPAHKHNRVWYNGDVAKLSDYKEWVCACESCHRKIDSNKELKEKVFEKLRP